MSNPKFNDPSGFVDPEDPEIVREAKKLIVEPVYYDFTERDVMLYALGVGATELKHIYESHEDFSVLPTFVAVPPFNCDPCTPLDWIPNYNPVNMLHAEVYYNFGDLPTFPTSGRMVSNSRILEVLDKGKAATVTTIIEIRDRDSGEFLYSSQSTQFIRKVGGFGGKKVGIDRGPASATNEPPNRPPDAVVEQKTTETQTALYRLSGDYNPLHIDPDFAAVGGFDKPILHGLCTFGFAGRHVLQTYGNYKDIKARFAGTVYPGETIVTEMWKEGNRVIFVAKVKERGTIALASCAATLVDDPSRAAKL